MQAGILTLSTGVLTGIHNQEFFNFAEVHCIKLDK
jgi:hypothetical protein